MIIILCSVSQSYEVNLLLTSILSTLAAFPHPMMEQWLFATTCSHSRNVYSILKKVTTAILSNLRPVIHVVPFLPYIAV